MDSLHPISDSEIFESELRSRTILYTKHFEEDRLPYRQNISKSLIEDYLSNHEDLLEFRYSEDSHEREKYEALFDKSSKYYLKIVLSMQDEELHIVTAHVINKTKKERSKIIG